MFYIIGLSDKIMSKIIIFFNLIYDDRDAE